MDISLLRWYFKCTKYNAYKNSKCLIREKFFCLCKSRGTKNTQAHLAFSIPLNGIWIFESENLFYYPNGNLLELKLNLFQESAHKCDYV